MLQGFNWVSHRGGKHYVNLSEQLKNFKRVGIDKLWLPPSSRSRDPEGYYPLEYYDMNTEYGTEDELRRLVASARDEGVGAIGELVCWYDFCGYKRQNYCFSGRERKIDSPELFDEFREYVKYMHDYVGFSGIRLDYLKSHPAHDVGLYLSDMKDIEFVGELWDTMNYTDAHLEYDQDRHRQGIVDYIDASGGKFNMFDFTLKGILQQALNAGEFWRLRDSRGNMPGANGWYASNVVTFIDNHDTLGQHLWSFSYNPDVVAAGYAYIMTHPGTPCVYYDHYHDIQEDLKTLIDIRSKLTFERFEITEASHERYVAKIDDITVVLGSRFDDERGRLIYSRGMAHVFI